jgi:quinol monooxygenase YgiN
VVGSPDIQEGQIMSVKRAVQLQIQPDKCEEFEAIAQVAAARVRAEDPGCEQYHLFQSLDDTSRYVLLESWATQEDLDAHRSSPGFGDFRKIWPLLAADPQVTRTQT